MLGANLGLLLYGDVSVMFSQHLKFKELDYFPCSCKIPENFILGINCLSICQPIVSLQFFPKSTNKLIFLVRNSDLILASK